MMTKKNYVMIARAINDGLQHSGKNALAAVILADVANELAKQFKVDNPAFRYDTFFEACGLDEWGAVRKG